MRKPKETGSDLEKLIKILENNNGMIRQKARESLVSAGKPAVYYLIRELQNSKIDHVRWEAAKALGSITDARSIRPLINALEDSDSDVAWLAAEALIKHKKTAWPPLLRLLIKGKSESIAWCQYMHHIFKDQKEACYNDLLAKLKIALDSRTSTESIKISAYDILKRLRTKSLNKITGKLV